MSHCYLTSSRRNMCTERHTYRDHSQPSFCPRHHGFVSKLMFFFLMVFYRCVVNELILWSVKELLTVYLGRLSDLAQGFPKVPGDICSIWGLKETVARHHHFSRINCLLCMLCAGNNVCVIFLLIIPSMFQSVAKILEEDVHIIA